MAQVGINTTTPKATLDITAKNLTGTSPDGLLIPRMDRLKAQNMSGTAISTLIYVNNISNGSLSGTTIDMNTPGFYYFDGAKWIKLSADTSKFVDKSIYTGNGNLEGNRTVAQEANTLAFTSTATTGTNHFSVDGNTFSVDAAKNRIGIGTTTPQNLLDLGPGNGRKLALWNSTTGDDFYGLGNAMNVLQLFAGAAAAGDPLMTLTKDGKVGIGTTSPATKLDVQGKVKIMDGTQGQDKVLISDANGVATWKSSTAVTPTTIGVFPTANTTVVSGGTAIPKYSNVSITLPKGKWIVNAGLTIYNRVADPAKSRLWLHAYLSSSTTNLQRTGFTLLGPAGSNTSYAGVLTYGGGVMSQNDYDLNFFD